MVRKYFAKINLPFLPFFKKMSEKKFVHFFKKYFQKREHNAHNPRKKTRFSDLFLKSQKLTFLKMSKIEKNFHERE